jgi:diaminopimelate epimerase
MIITFYKYQGTGNDFVVIDNRNQLFPKDNHSMIAKLCDRRFGVGADGLLLLENHHKVDFTMVYYNADGKVGSMCGNGGRCMVHFAKYLNIINENTVFEAVDGLHEASINNEIVALKMNDVDTMEVSANSVFLNTGSPHHVEMVEDLKNYNVTGKGAAIRNNTYGKEGANINFVEKVKANLFAVRTYERGVEAETLSCGTGVTAVAIALSETNRINTNNVELHTEGGKLWVHFEKTNDAYYNVYLEGPAKQVFKGEWEW